MIKLWDYLDGRRCKECGLKSMAEKRRFSYQFVKDTIENEGDILISKEYFRQKDFLKIQCGDCDKQYDIKFIHFRDGGRCDKCKKRRNYTYDYVKKLIEGHGNKLLSSIFSDCDMPLNIQCGKCDHVFTNSWTYYRTGPKCLICLDKMRYSQKEVQSIIDIEGDILMSEYTHYKKDLEIQCSDCNKIYYASFLNFQRGSRCKCKSKNKYYSEEFVQKFISDNGDELLSNYEDFKKPMQINCHVCKNTYSMSFCKYLRRNKCKHCVYNKRKHTYDYVTKIITEGGDNLLSKSYINCSSKLKIECKDCSGEYLGSFSSYTSGHRCGRKACISKRISDKKKHGWDYLMDIFDKNGDIPTSDYLGVDKPISFLCHKCDKEHSLTFYYYKKGYNCDKTQSLGELRIEAFLDEIGLLNEPQKRFEDCKNIRSLPFDFFICDEIKFLIEYQGRQHFEVMNFFGGEEGFEERLVNDGIKVKYCREKNIPLLIIPYWEYDNIEEIIEKFIASLRNPEPITKKKTTIIKKNPEVGTK